MPTPSSSGRDLRDPRTDGGHNGGLIFRLGLQKRDFVKKGRL